MNAIQRPARGPLHILHVGSGFRPLRWGGLVAYVEDLMAEQVRRGYRVSYFFSGRHYRWPGRTRLKRWHRNGVEMLEVINSPLFDHGHQPELELDEPLTEGLFERTLAELDPDLIHVQELAGLPSSITEVAHQTGAPVLMTLQDYFPLCSTFKLLDADGRVCLRHAVGPDCLATVRGGARQSNLLLDGTLRYEIERRFPVRVFGARWREALVQKVVHSRLAIPPKGTGPLDDPDAFQRRRDVNVGRLNAVDLLIAMSTRVAEIYEQLGVDREHLTTMQLTLAHIDELTPRRTTRLGPLTFATVGGAESTAKGARVLLDAARRLSTEGSGLHRLLIYGRTAPGFAAEAEEIDGVELRGSYRPDQLNDILDEVDVGIMPSIWEEAYGFAGMEFIAKGIPLIANQIGGMVDYVIDGETGWLNRSCSGRGLAELISNLTAAPERVADARASTLAARDRLVMPMPRHVDAMDAMYEQLWKNAARPKIS